MDKIFSARVNEAVIRRIGSLARQLKTTKKAVVERAIGILAEVVEEENGLDVLEQTLGAWRRRESPAKTVERARKAFHRSMTRRQK